MTAGKLLISWSHPPGLNRRPADYESAALPAELGWLVQTIYTTPSYLLDSQVRRSGCSNSITSGFSISALVTSTAGRSTRLFTG